MATEEVVLENGEVVVIETPDQQGFGERVWENVKGIPYGALDAAVLTPAHALWNLPSNFKKALETQPYPDPFGSFGKAGVKSYLDASTRNVPPEEKINAQQQTVGGLGGGGIGAIAGSPLGPVGMGIGGWLGSNLGSFLTNQYQQWNGQSPDTPIGKDLEMTAADLVSSGAEGLAMGPITRTGMRQVTNRMARGGAKLSEAAQRLTDQDSLRASALSMKPGDQAIRPPRRAPSSEALQGEVVDPLIARDVTKNQGLPEIDGARQSTIDGVATPMLNSPDASLPAVLADAGDVAIPAPGEPLSTSIDAATSSPGGSPQQTESSAKASAARGRYSLKQAVAEVPEFFEYKRNIEQDEFPQLLTNIQQKTDVYNKGVDQILRDLPKEANQPIQSALFKRILELASEKMDPFGIRKPYRDVAVGEIEKFASRLLPNPNDAQEFRQLFRKHRTFQDGGSTPLDSFEMQRLEELTEQAGNIPLTPIELRGLKTEYDKLGRWESASIAGSSDQRAAAMRKDAYREIANNIRETLVDTVKQYAPNDSNDYRAYNRKLYLGSKFTSLAEDRADQQLAGGRGFKEEPLVASAKNDLPLLGPLARWATEKAAPQMYSPNARLIAADSDPANFGTGGGMSGPIADVTGKSISRVGQAGTAALSALDKSPGLRQTLAGANQNEDPSIYKNYIAPGLDKIGSAFSSVFSVPEAKSEDFAPGMMPPPPQLLPRDTDRLSSEAIVNLLSQTASRPEAPIAQQLVGKLEKAFRAEDIETIEKLHSDLARLFPDLFEPGMGINGKIFYPDEQEKYMSTLKQLHRMGKVDSIHLAKQTNAFKNPQDSRMLPIKPFEGGKSGSKPMFSEGTRVYSY